MSQQTGSNAVRLMQPAAGNTVNVPINAQNMRLSLGFEPDPNAVEKNGQNLEFSFEDGGKIVLEGYYDHFEGQTLPVMVTENGDELSGEDFLASLREDLLTAAGPGAGAGAPGSGAGEYADDAGALIDGIDRLGALGTSGVWRAGIEGEIEEPSAAELPALDFTIAFVTSLGVPGAVGTDEQGLVFGRFVNVLFEDGLPNQHKLGQQHLDPANPLAGREPGILELIITPAGTTTATNVALSGFTPGTVIAINGEIYAEITSAAQIVNLDPALLALQTVAVYPPLNNSDADMNITCTVTGVTLGGLEAAFTDTFVLTVDAVADLPLSSIAEFGAETFAFESEDGQIRYSTDPAPKDGETELGVQQAVTLNNDVYVSLQASSTGQGENDINTTEAATIDLPVDVMFTDVADGSEAHAITISGVPSDWTLTGLPNGLVLPEGVTLADVNAALQDTGSYTFTVPTGADAAGLPGFNADADSFTVDGSFVFAPGDWTNERLHDGTANEEGPAAISITASSEEINLSGNELNAAAIQNNTAEETVVYRVDIAEDKPVITTEDVWLCSDETRGVQVADDLNEISRRDPKLAAVLQYLEEAGMTLGRPVSVAQNEITYDMKSDGDKDGRTDANAFPAVKGSYFAFQLPDNGDDPVPSGWTTTSGEAINLVVNPDFPGCVTGVTESGKTAFVVAATGEFNDGDNTGNVTFIQYMPLRHPEAGTQEKGKHNEELASNLALTLVVYDADGDVSNAVDITVNVLDDGPRFSFGNASFSVNLSETDLFPAGTDRFHHDNDVPGNRGDESKIFGTFGPFDFGADGPHAEQPFTWVEPEGAYLTTAGNEVRWSVSDGGLTMTGYEVVGYDGQGAPILGEPVVTFKAWNVEGLLPGYKVVQHQAMQHGKEGTPTDDVFSIKAGFTIKDGDGDTVTGAFAVNIHDDAPEIYYPNGRQHPINVSETDLSAGTDPNHKVNNIDFNVWDEQNYYRGVIAFTYGADGPYVPKDEHDETLPFTWVAPADDAYQTVDAAGKPVNIHWSVTDGYVLTGVNVDTGEPVITVKTTHAYDGQMASGVKYDVYLEGPLFNYKDNGKDWDEKIPVELDFIVTDGDGDSVKGNVTVTVHDDAPIGCVCTFGGMVFEMGLRDGISDCLLSTKGSLSLIYGADGPHAETPFTWNLPQAGDKLAQLEGLDGKPLAWSFLDDDPTKMIASRQDTGEMVLEVTANLDGCAPNFTFELHGAIKHPADPAWRLDSFVKDLKMGYTIMDADGDAATNYVHVQVVDSFLLPSVDFSHIDETRTGEKSKVIYLDHLDYGAPDADSALTVSWNEAMTKVAIEKFGLNADPLKNGGGLRASGKEGNLVCEFDDNVLTLKAEDDTVVAILTLLGPGEGANTHASQWAIHYEMLHGLAHPLGTFAHNDALLVPLFVDAGDKESVTVPNAVGVVITDDGPKGQFSSNIAILDNMADALLDGVNGITGGTLYDALHKFVFDENHNIKIDLGALVQDVLKVGKDVGSEAVNPENVIDLLIMFGGPSIAQGIKDWTAESPEWLLPNVKNWLNNAADSMFNDKNRPVEGTLDADANPVHSGGVLNVDYGFDGPAVNDATLPVGWNLLHHGAQPAPAGWSVMGVQAMLDLLNIRSALDPDARLVVREADAPKTYPSQTLEVRACGENSNGELVMTLKIVTDDKGNATYAIEQESGLFHDPATILNTLLDLVSDLTGDLLGTAVDAMVENMVSGIRDASGDKTANSIADVLKGIINGVVDPDSFAKMLGTDNMLYLPLPYITMDADGDISANLIFQAMRDSEPKMLNGYTFTGAVDERYLDQLDVGSLFVNGMDNTEHVQAEGSFTVDSFDGVRGLFIDGTLHTFDANGKLVLDYGPGEFVFTLAPGEHSEWTVKYAYTLNENADHQNIQGIDPTLQNKYPVDADGNLLLAFQVVDGDGDKTPEAKITIEITDDVSVAPNAPTSISFDEPADLSGITGEFDGFQFGADGPAETAAITVNGTSIPLNGNTEIIEGLYGDLEVSWNAAEGKFEYTYKVSEEKLAANGGDLHQQADYAQARTDLPGVTVAAINNVHDHHGEATLSDLQKTATGTVSHSEGKGLGVASDPGGTALGATYASTLGAECEGMLFTFDSPALGGSVTIGGLDAGHTHADKGTVYFYGIDGNLLGSQHFEAPRTGPTSLAVEIQDGAVGMLIVPDHGAGQSVLPLPQGSQFYVKGIDVTLDAQESFKFTLTDGDGDSASQYLHVDVKGAVFTEVRTDSLLVNEGKLYDVGTGGGVNELTGFAALSLTAANAEALLDVIAINGTALVFAKENGVLTATAESIAALDSLGYGTITGATLKPVNGNYELQVDYTLEKTYLDHSDEEGRDITNTAPDGFTISVAGKEFPITVNIEDDIPESVSPVVANVNAASVEASLEGVWGADGAHKTQGATFQPNEDDYDNATGMYETDLTSDGKAIYYEISDNGDDESKDSVLTAKYQDGNEWKTVFTVTLNAAENSYKVEMSGKVDLLPGGGDPLKLDGKQLGETSTIWLTSEGTTKDEPDANAKWATVTATGGNFSGSVHGLAVKDGDFSSGESMRFDFSKPQAEVTFSLANVNGALSGSWTAYGEDGETIVAQGSFDDKGLIVNGQGSIFHSVEVTVDQGSCLLSDATFNTGLESLEPSLSLPVQIMDGDGDTASGALTLNFKPVEESKFLLGTNDAETLSGGGADDIIVGDTGGAEFADPIPKSVNLAVVLDKNVSSDALFDVFKQIETHEAEGATVSLTLIGVGDHANTINSTDLLQDNRYVTFNELEELEELEVRVPDTLSYYDTEGVKLDREPNPIWGSTKTYYSITPEGTVTHIKREGDFWDNDAFKTKDVPSSVGTRTELSDSLLKAIADSSGANLEAGLNAADRWLSATQDKEGYDPATTVNQVFVISGAAPTTCYVDMFKVGNTELHIPEGYVPGDTVSWDNGKYYLDGDGYLCGVSKSQTVTAYLEGKSLGGLTDTSFSENKFSVIAARSIWSPDVTKDEFAALVAAASEAQLADFETNPAFLVTDNNSIGDALTSVLDASLNDPVINPDAVGNDEIHGGGGNDIIFGDAVNADWLLAEESAATWNADNALAPGGGMDIVKAYLAHDKEVSVDEVDSDMVAAFIQANHPALGQSDSVLVDGAPRGGNDTIYGDDGNDVIYGGGGNDVIIGGAGNDELWGGDGDDLFVWKAEDLDGGGDIIKDFQLGKDHLFFENLLPTEGELNVDQLVESLQNNTLGVVVTDDQNLQLTVASDETHSVTVEIHLAEGSVADYVEATTHDDQAALLIQILTNSGV